MQTEIAEILNNIREENQRNVENFEKILSGVSSKLDMLSENDEAVDLVKFYIAELKKAVEDKHSSSMIRFDALAASYESIVSSQSQLAKTSELKDLFGMLSAHNEAFLTEILSQKDLLDDLKSQISTIGEKTFGKEELVSLIQDVSLDLSVLGESIQKSFLQVNESLKNQTSEQLTKINESVEELKGIVASAPDYSHEFENLENKLGNILTETEFSKFREDLGNFVQKIIDNSYTLNSEMVLSAEKILDAVNSVEYPDFKDEFTGLKDCLEELKGISYQKSFDELYRILANVSDNVSALRASVGADVQENYGAVKVCLDGLITNLQIIKDDLISVIENNKFEASKILSSIDSLKQNVLMISSDIKENSNSNYGALKGYVEEVLAGISSISDSLSVLKTDAVINGEKISEIIDNINKFEPVDYSYDLQQVSSKLDDLAGKNVSISVDVQEKFENIKDLVQSIDNSEAIKFQFESFERAFSRIVTAEDFHQFKVDFTEFIQKIIDNSNFLHDNSNNLIAQSNEGFEKVNAAIADLSANVQYLRDISSYKPSEILDNINSCINDAVEKLNSNSELNFADLKNSFEKVISEISEIKNDFVHKNDTNIYNISSGFDSVKLSLENVVSALHSMGATSESISALDEKVSRLNDVVSLLYSDLSMKKEEIVHHVDDANDIYSTQIKGIAENIDSIKGYIDEGAECLKNYLAELEVSANSARVSSDEKLTQKILDLETSLVQSTGEYEQKMELLQAKITEFAHIVENSNSDTEGKIASSLDEIQSIKTELSVLNDGLKSSKISVDEKFGETISLIDAGIENIIFNLTNLSDNVTNGVNSLLEENISGIGEKFDNLIEITNEIKEQHSLNNVDLIQDIENKIIALKDELGLINSDIAGAVECKSEEIIRAFEPVKIVIEEFKGFNFEKVLSDLKSQIELSFMNLSVDFNNEFASNSANVLKLEQAFKETFSKLSDIDECLNEKVHNNIELLDATLQTAVRDIKFNFEGKIEEQIIGLRNYIDVALNKNNFENCINNLKENFENQIEEVSSKLDVIVSGTSVEKLNGKFDELSRNVGGIDDKFDILTRNFDGINDRFKNISQTEVHVSDVVSALHAKVDALAADSSYFDILEELDGIKDIIFEQRKFFEFSSDEKASAIDKYLRDVLLKLDSVDLEKNAEDIKEVILNALVSLVDQISFVEETEEIKDFVEEKTEEINLHLDEVKKQLKQLTSPGDDFDYTYTLQDVESDIAKLRLAVLNMSGNDFSDISDEIKKIVDAVEGLETSLTQEQIVDLKSDIEKLNEDIVSISSRTNKLLLNSDEAYKALNDGLNNFSNVIYNLEDRINYLDNTDASERVERKLDNIHSLAVEADNASKVSRQVMMYLGEWIDTAGESINVISERTSEIDTIKENIQELREVIPEKTTILDELERKFELQDERIDRLEMGLDKILSILEQKDDTILERKVDNMEKLLSALERNIEKLTSYVDE